MKLNTVFTVKPPPPPTLGLWLWPFKRLFTEIQKVGQFLKMKLYTLFTVTSIYYLPNMA